MESQLLLLVLLIALSGVFSGAEIALTSLSAAKVKTLKNDKRFGAKAVFKLKKKPERLLITILIGNNLVNIFATVIATVWATTKWGSSAVGIVTGVLTAVVLIFGEITPKTLAQKYADTFSRTVAYPLLWLRYLLSPISWVLEKFIHGLMRTLNAKSPMQSMSEEEILAMVDIGTQEGVIEEDEQELIENVLEFSDTIVEEVMTVRDNIEAMPANTTVREAAQFFVEHSHSRIPVYEKNLDNIIGIITVHDVLHLTHHEKDSTAKKLKELHFNAPIIVPKTKAIDKLFRKFQFTRKHIAIVVDERGKTVGLVTMEDIIEEIMGEIADEQDQDLKKIHKLEKNKWEADPEATIQEMDEALDIEFDYPEHQTISLLILEELQGFPKEGQSIEKSGILFEVKKMSKKRIEKVHLAKMSQPGQLNGKDED